MSDQDSAAPRTDRRYRLATAAVVLAVTAMLGGSGWWLFSGRTVAGYALPDGAIPIGDRDVCANTVTVMLGTDAEMMAVARALRGDPRVLRSYTETKQDGYVRFRKMFANEPELLELTSADALPASVTVVPKDQTDTEGIAEQLRVQFPEARKVSDNTELRSRITGPGYRDPTCPPSGERSP
ncbi:MULTISPECIES: permease-like cell division protein FtsX [unclassified Amycolatopsis]|uniref:permease-like cell division protein FtsX n=1 Tax=unclassified Amycolatopsis TaxID=2618356 RepID=UPI00106EEA9A|nr:MULTISPECIES: permease-like cell division protein FtsX [unclassified Amycolatopsis]